jgi:hypothetical protein
VRPQERPLEKTPSRRFFCFAVFRREQSFESAILAGAEKSEIFPGDAPRTAAKRSIEELRLRISIRRSVDL